MRLFQTLGAFLLVAGTWAAAGCGQNGAPSQASSQSASRASGAPSQATSQAASQSTSQATAAAYPAEYPDDVYPDSRNRLPLIQREEMDEQGQTAYDSAVSNPRSLAGLQGPAGIRLHSARSRESEYLRYESDLGRRLTELAILVTAREMDQQFEWTVHEGVALQEGLEPAIIEVVRLRQPLTGLGEKEAAIIQLGREVFRNHRLSPDTFARALQLFGDKTLVDLVSLMGNYASTAVLLTTFDQQLPPGQKPLLPIP
ncbi:MAG: hypothetical protein IH935_01440 [Acidobacteria bacterium]|nr:hypothetical protein [Acidobacteriota bacterium]